LPSGTWPDSSLLEIFSSSLKVTRLRAFTVKKGVLAVLTAEASLDIHDNEVFLAVRASSHLGEFGIF